MCENSDIVCFSACEYRPVGSRSPMAQKASHEGLKGVHLCNLLNFNSRGTDGVCSGGIQWKTKACKQIREWALIPAPEIVSKPGAIWSFTENSTERVCVSVADIARDKSVF